MKTEDLSPNVKSVDIDRIVDVAENLVDVMSTKRTIKEKLQSRKLWACIALLVVGTCGIFGFSNDTTAIIAFVIMDILAVAMYVITEGYIDAVHIKEFIRAFGSLAKMVNEGKATQDAQDALNEAEQTYNTDEDRRSEET